MTVTVVFAATLQQYWIGGIVEILIDCEAMIWWWFGGGTIIGDAVI